MQYIISTPDSDSSAWECDPTVGKPEAKTGRIEELWGVARDSDDGSIAWEVSLDNRV